MALQVREGRSTLTELDMALIVERLFTALEYGFLDWNAVLPPATGVATVTGTPPIVSTGGGNPAISLSDAGVTLAKMADIATDRLIGRVSAGTGVPEAVVFTDAGQALLDDADAATQRTTLGLGTLATQSGTFSGTSSGTNTGDQAVLLKSNSGTDTSAGATNVDTYAISGLTAKDRLLILYDMSSLTNYTEAPRFYSVTDSLVLAYATAGGGQLALGTSVAGSTVISQSQQSTTVVNSITAEGGGRTTGGGDFGTGSVGGGSQAVTTAWTGSWTISFRHSGVAGGGTFRWSWSVYKMLGQ